MTGGGRGRDDRRFILAAACSRRTASSFRMESTLCRRCLSGPLAARSATVADSEIQHANAQGCVPRESERSAGLKPLHSLPHACALRTRNRPCPAPIKKHKKRSIAGETAKALRRGREDGAGRARRNWPTTRSRLERSAASVSCRQPEAAGLPTNAEAKCCNCWASLGAGVKASCRLASSSPPPPPPAPCDVLQVSGNSAVHKYRHSPRTYRHATRTPTYPNSSPPTPSLKTRDN